MLETWETFFAGQPRQPSQTATLGSHFGWPSQAAISDTLLRWSHQATIMGGHLGQPSWAAILGDLLEHPSWADILACCLCLLCRATLPAFFEEFLGQATYLVILLSKFTGKLCQTTLLGSFMEIFCQATWLDLFVGLFYWPSLREPNTIPSQFLTPISV